MLATASVKSFKELNGYPVLFEVTCRALTTPQLFVAKRYHNSLKVIQLSFHILVDLISFAYGRHLLFVDCCGCDVLYHRPDLYRFIGPPSTDSPYSHGEEISTETFVSRQEFHDSKPVIRTSSAFGTLVGGFVILAASLFFIGSSRD